MTHELIIKKAVEKAIKSGWKEHLFQDKKIAVEMVAEGSSIMTNGHRYYRISGAQNFVFGGLAYCSILDLIFSHDFAKAFWPGNQYCYLCDELIREGQDFCKMHDERYKLHPTFEYHLREMVLEKEPVRYLEKFL